MKRFETTKNLIKTYKKKKASERECFQNFDKKSTFYQANANYQELQHVDLENLERNAKENKTKED